MRVIGFLLAVGLLSACSNVGEFERELTGEQAAAWQLCKPKIGEVDTVPRYGEHTDEHILFAWHEKEAMENGGPIMCKTNGSGTELIEVRVSAAPF